MNHRKGLSEGRRWVKGALIHLRHQPKGGINELEAYFKTAYIRHIFKRNFPGLDWLGWGCQDFIKMLSTAVEFVNHPLICKIFHPVPRWLSLEVRVTGWCSFPKFCLKAKVVIRTFTAVIGRSKWDYFRFSESNVQMSLHTVDQVEFCILTSCGSFETNNIITDAHIWGAISNKCTSNNQTSFFVSNYLTYTNKRC